MHFTPILTVLTCLASAAQAAEWNDQLKVWDVGLVPDEPGHPGTPALYLPFNCGGIPQGGYVCGSFVSGDNIVALRAIYICVNGQFIRNEVCNDGLEQFRCVKNSRRPHHRFYPAVDGEKIVCRIKSDVDKP